MARFETITRELGKLKALTRPRSQDPTEVKLQLVATAQGLMDLSDDAIETGCAAWAQSNQWFPTLAELRTECIRYGATCTLPAPKKPVFSDKRWWYKNCLKHKDDAITWSKAREIYPTMFHIDGSLVDLGQINFHADDRIRTGREVNPTQPDRQKIIKRMRARYGYAEKIPASAEAMADKPKPQSPRAPGPMQLEAQRICEEAREKFMGETAQKQPPSVL